jgi:radical SAM superfamily enzyme YgiQ (UPF0313 family)
VDLLYLSGRLSGEHDVCALDAAAERLSAEESWGRLEALRPEAAVCLVSAPSFDDDFAFLSQAKRRNPVLRLVATGDFVRELREEVFARMPFLDAVLTDFSTDDILRYLGGPGGAVVENVIYRHRGGLVAGPETHKTGPFSVPAPRWELFPGARYRFPFVRREPFMTVLSDFGCPFQCSFCAMSTLGFKLRPVAEVVEELVGARRAGYREVHFRDQTFGYDGPRTLELCAAIKGALPGLSWSCISRVDVLDEPRVGAMAEAGCHTAILGIEFADEDLHRRFGKGIRREQMFRAVALCHDYGLEVVGTFILGVPGQDRDGILRSAALAEALELDYVSFNLAVPCLGTPWRAQLLKEGAVHEGRWRRLEPVGGTDAWNDATIAPEDLRALRSEVQRRFYLRPSYLIRRVFGLRTLPQARALLANGWTVLGG